MIIHIQGGKSIANMIDGVVIRHKAFLFVGKDMHMN